MKPIIRFGILVTILKARYGVTSDDTVDESQTYSEATYATLFLYQNGTDLGMDFIGLRIKFADPNNADACLDANSYVFEMLVWNDPQEKFEIIMISFLKANYNDFLLKSKCA